LNQSFQDTGKVDKLDNILTTNPELAASLPTIVFVRSCQPLWLLLLLIGRQCGGNFVCAE
jgi:hypothetical protein